MGEWAGIISCVKPHLLQTRCPPFFFRRFFSYYIYTLLKYHSYNPIFLELLLSASEISQQLSGSSNKTYLPTQGLNNSRQQPKAESTSSSKPAGPPKSSETGIPSKRKSSNNTPPKSEDVKITLDTIVISPDRTKDSKVTEGSRQNPPIKHSKSKQETKPEGPIKNSTKQVDSSTTISTKDSKETLQAKPPRTATQLNAKASKAALGTRSENLNPNQSKAEVSKVSTPTYKDSTEPLPPNTNINISSPEDLAAKPEKDINVIGLKLDAAHESIDETPATKLEQTQNIRGQFQRSGKMPTV